MGSTGPGTSGPRQATKTCLDPTCGNVNPGNFSTCIKCKKPLDPPPPPAPTPAASTTAASTTTATPPAITPLPDGKQLLAYPDGTVKVFDPATSTLTDVKAASAPPSTSSAPATPPAATTAASTPDPAPAPDQPTPPAPPPVPKYFLLEGGTHKGPYTIDQLKTMAQNGEIKRETQVWTQSQGNDWKSVKDVPALTDVVAQIPSPPPAPAAPAHTEPNATGEAKPGVIQRLVDAGSIGGATGTPDAASETPH